MKEKIKELLAEVGNLVDSMESLESMSHQELADEVINQLTCIQVKDMILSAWSIDQFVDTNDMVELGGSYSPSEIYAEDVLDSIMWDRIAVTDKSKLLDKLLDNDEFKVELLKRLFKGTGIE